MVIDAKTGKPSPSHLAQVLIYQYAVPLALKEYPGGAFRGHVAYPDSQVGLPASVADLAALIWRLAAKTPARRVPSAQECQFCNITRADCSERVEEKVPGEGTTGDF